ERINELMGQFAEVSAVKVEYLQHALLPTIRANAQDLFEAGTDKLKSIASLPRELAAAIKSVKFDKKTGTVAEIVLSDKVAAVNTLLRSVGGLIDKVEVSEYEKMTSDEVYIKALEAAVDLFKVLGLPQENITELTAMIEQVRAEGFAEDRAK